ncbi:ribonuclease P protein component [Buchnera aphidicola]|uniref:ribonuclease P protein component n=1 Tax=Buchnera aphidicola TaxID=9 RepID=UPI003463AEF5
MNNNQVFCFKKKSRLLTFQDFHHAFRNSHKKNTSLAIVLTVINKLYYPRLGIIVSKKISRYSYKRNLIKRIIRESFRLIKTYLLNLDFVIIAKISCLKVCRKKFRDFLNILWMKYYQ